jgi:hypothetical protein
MSRLRVQRSAAGIVFHDHADRFPRDRQAAEYVQLAAGDYAVDLLRALRDRRRGHPFLRERGAVHETQHQERNCDAGGTKVFYFHRLLSPGICYALLFSGCVSFDAIRGWASCAVHPRCR